MKITKAQLKEIIKEEHARLLREYTDPDVSSAMLYTGPDSIEEEIKLLDDVYYRLREVTSAAPDDARIMEALGYLENAIDMLRGDG